jgi:hypothetical protein
VCSENRHDLRMLFETNIQQVIHLAVSLQDILMIFIEQDLILKEDTGAYNHV